MQAKKIFLSGAAEKFFRNVYNIVTKWAAGCNKIYKERSEKKVREKNMETSEKNVQYKTCKKLFGKLYKLGFSLIVGLMSVGTLLIVLYTFFGRGLIG